MRGRARRARRVAADRKEADARRSHGRVSNDETLTINGVETIVLTAGRGQPLVFLHGAGICTD